MSHASIQYCFKGEEHCVKPKPYENSRKSDSYVRTMPSTLKKLKDVCQDLTLKFAIFQEGGDILTASSAGSIPRNRQQIADMRQCQEVKGRTRVKSSDPLFSVMLMCKESEGGRRENFFVRMVTGALEPMTVLAYDGSLDDIQRFCTQPQCTVLTVDPTFNLGDVDVTVTTYRHLLLKNANGCNPVMLGPVLVHQRKRFETYHFFALSLTGLKPLLADIHAFGKDGEKAFSAAFQTVFRQAVHLQCFLHFKSNLEAKLGEFSVPKHAQIEFIRDVFGDPVHIQDGLVDAEGDSLQVVWDERERAYHDPPEFFQWFVHYCKEVRTTMLKEKRRKVVLGDPSQPFYTNDVKSVNSVIKHQTKYRTQEVPQFIPL